MHYTVYYKSPGELFWHKIRKVVGDFILEDKFKNTLPVRVIVTEKQIQYHLPLTWLIKFGRDRFYFIQSNMDKEAGQKVNLIIPGGKK